VGKSSQIMTIKEVAKYLKMNERTVYKLIQAGQIPAAKLGKQWRLDKGKLNEWIGFQMADMANEDLALLEKDHKEVVIKIVPLLKEKQVIFNFYAASKSQAIQKLVQVLVSNNNISPVEGKNLLRNVMERERLCSTAIGEGVAVPHPRDAVISKLKKPLLAAGICSQGMDFESIDGKPTNIVVLVSAPRNDIHLKLMARLSRLLRDKVFRYKLIQAEDFKTFKNIIQKKEFSLDKGGGDEKIS